MDFGFFSNSGGDPTQAYLQHQQAKMSYTWRSPTRNGEVSMDGSTVTRTPGSQTNASVSGWGSGSYANGDTSTGNSGAYQGYNIGVQSASGNGTDAQSYGASQGQGGAQSRR